MVQWEQWREKAKSSLEAARILLDGGKPIEATSRAYFAAWQMVTAVLRKLNFPLPTDEQRREWGHWGHSATQELFANQIANRATSERGRLQGMKGAFRSLLALRVVADYKDVSGLTPEIAMRQYKRAQSIIETLGQLIEWGEL